MRVYHTTAILLTIPDTPMSSSSCMQEQANNHTSRRSQGDNDEKFETSPHRMLTGIAGFDCSQHHSRERRKSIGPPSGLRQREEHRDRWDEATDYKGKANLHSLQPGIDACVFDHPQLIMHHSPMPAVLVRREVIDDPLQEGTGEPFVLVDGHQFRPFLVWFMLNLIPLDGDAPVKDLLGGPCGQVTSQRH